MKSSERIQIVLGYSADEYARLVEEAGYGWVTRFTLNPDAHTVYGRSAMFWKWWVNEWNLRDEQFLSDTGLRFADKPLTGYPLACALDIYVAFHNINKLDIVPNRWVHEEVARMIREMERELNEQLNPQTNNMSKITELENQLRHEQAKYKMLDMILDAVCKTTGITEAQLRGKDRSRSVTDSRHAFYYLVGQQSTFTYSLQELGKYLNRDHCTVLHSRKVSRDYMAVDASFQKMIGAIKKQLPSILLPMTQDQRLEAYNLLTERIEQLTYWLSNHPDNPYRAKIQSDIRELENERKQITTEAQSQNQTINHE